MHAASILSSCIAVVVACVVLYDNVELLVFEKVNYKDLL